ncbi:sulfite exporter TauE/SafE family protein [Priestia megaterium]|uniref:sulfite exporter TauE/SafE family protein n=2 Tax=Priestia megaterium TaxID=1404 RepID=UPI000BED3632|nr:TSUP family transporter [Priestia megaterium]MDP9579864.1 putative membrane protein YfcA [Bacillus sp. 1751]MDH2449514.1 TSUP family transporter [Priestia megaterium]MDH3144281.1 TSUP family transporter [Priestia megaterium]MDL5148972.1 TSUP family transporter [Priestia megaterium]MED4068427.1 TSUP family transporter [Priestia megaterium]
MAEIFDGGITITLVLFFCCFLAGFIDSVAGGGGLIMVPSFILAGFPAQTALAQEKLVGTIGTMVAIRNYMKNKKIVWKIASYGIITAIIGAYVGAKLILFFDEELVGKIIVFLFPIGLILTILPKKQHTSGASMPSGKLALFIVLFVCFTAGFYDGFFGPGTGSLMIILFHYVVKFTLLEASATSKIFNFASNIGALIAFIIGGHVLLLKGIPMILGNILGNYIGSNMAIKQGDTFIKKTLVTSLSILFISLIYKYFFHDLALSIFK